MKKLIKFFIFTVFIFSLSLFYLNEAFALPQNFVKTKLATNLSEPTDFVFTPDGRIFVTEANGTIKVIKSGQLLLTPLVKVSATNQGGDRGLLSIVLDPDFENSKFIYLYYTNANSLDNRITRLTVSGDKAGLSTEVVLFKTTQPLQPNHHGGQLVFGPDGKLWLGIGENSNSQNSQDLSNVHGKLIRINKDGTIPSDNPFVNKSGKHPAIWSYGLRNPFRLTFNSSGVPVIADVGGSTYEEINLGVKGGNFGWPICEGNFRGNTSDTCPNQFIKPLFAYPHSGGASITGGFFYNAVNFPSEYRGNYFFGDYVQGFIRRLSFNPTIEAKEFDPNAGTVVSLKESPDGQLFFLNVFPGELYSIKFSTGNQPPLAKVTADKTYGDKPLTVKFSSAGSSDPEGKALTYKWDFKDGNRSIEKTPTHTFKKKGLFNISLVVNDGEVDSQPVAIEISVGNLPPTIESLAPVDGSKYNAGDNISYFGNATDPENKKLPNSAYSWEIIFHHADHIHPFLGPIKGKTSGQFTIPNIGEFEANVFYEIKLTVTDKEGFKATKSTFVRPNKINLTLATEPSGIELKYNGTPYVTPKILESVVGFKHTIEAPETQVINNITYTFDSWSDGGSARHTVVAPNSDTTYKTIYKTDDGGGGSTSFMINPGETKNIPANSVISGDVKLNGQALYDNDGSTGLAVLMEQAGDVNAPWGATVYTHSDRQSAQTRLNQIADDMKVHGCGGSCRTVTKYFWPSGQTSVWTAPPAAPQGAAQPVDEPSPSPSSSPLSSPIPSPSSNPSSQPETSPEATQIPSPAIETKKDEEES